MPTADHASDATAGTPDRSAAHPRDRSRLVILLIACFRLVKGLALVAIFLFELKVLADPRAEAQLRGWAWNLGVDPDRHHVGQAIAWLTALGGENLHVYEAATILYAALFLVEAIGLFLGRRWAEWLVVVSTSLLIPLECWRIIDHRAWRHAWVVALNLAIVAYLFAHVRRRTAA